MGKVTSKTERAVQTRGPLLDKAVAFATIVAALGAVYFGYQQKSINSRLMQMSQVVAVTAVVEDGDSGEMLLRNTGKLNLRLSGFAIEDRKWVYRRPILVAANTGGDPGHPIQPGREGWQIVSKHGSATLTIFLEDEIERKWVSQIGLRKADEKGRVRILSYETTREDWELRLPSDRAASNNAEFVEGASFIRPGNR